MAGLGFIILITKREALLQQMEKIGRRILSLATSDFKTESLTRGPFE